MSIYNRGAALMTRMANDPRFKQAGGTLIKEGAPTGPAYDPQPSTPEEYEITGIFLRDIDTKYVMSGIAVSTDKQADIPPFAASPEVGDKLTAEDVTYDVVQVMRKPAAGALVAWRLILRA